LVFTLRFEDLFYRDRVNVRTGFPVGAGFGAGFPVGAGFSASLFGGIDIGEPPYRLMAYIWAIGSLQINGIYLGSPLKDTTKRHLPKIISIAGKMPAPQ
jgi:hypothetical protein